MSNKPNALFVHGIIVIVVGAVLLGLGAWGTIQLAMRRTRNVSSASTTLSKSRTEMNRVQRLKQAPGALLRKPTSPFDAVRRVNQGAYLWRTIKGYLSMGWQILLGIGMIAAGVFVLKQKNWARLVGFGGIGFAALLFASYAGAGAASPNASVALPLVLVALVAGLSSKPLFDLAIEKFD